MREIKFRAWNKTEGFLEGHHDGFSEDTDVLVEVWKCLNSYDFVVQQFTGRKDKNGKEIYEGDLIKFMGEWDKDGKVLPPTHKIYQVSGATGCFMAHSVLIEDRIKSCGSDRKWCGHTDSEIIGNILENPELLK